MQRDAIEEPNVSDRECDVAIIGAGTAGLSAERSARRAGARTILIDEKFAGTTCASVGCMPSKLLIAASRAAHGVAGAARFGIHAGTIEIDGEAVLRRVREMRDDFVSSVLKSFNDIPDDAKIMGTARFLQPGLLDVDGVRVRAKAVVLATGSRTSIPRQFNGLKNVLTNETVFELADLPSSLAVIGAGPLGIELAQAFTRLGTNVAVFDEGDNVAAMKDDDVSQSLRELLNAEMDLHLKTSVSASQRGRDVELSWIGATSGKRKFSHVLVAAGRPPNLNHLALSKAGLALDVHGIPVFDRETMQCGSSSIFLAGDCNHDVPVLHEASAEGAIAGYNAASFPIVKRSKRATALAITFTDPPSASVGKAAGSDSVIGESNFSDQGRAKVDGRGAGLLRIYADESGKLTGAAAAVPEAEHLAHLIAWAIESRLTAMQLLELPIYHPTYEEGLRKALRQICDQTNVRFSADRDEGWSPGI